MPMGSAILYHLRGRRHPYGCYTVDTIVENASEELVSSILFRQFNGFTKEAFIFFGQLIRIVHDGGDEVQSGRIHNDRP